MGRRTRRPTRGRTQNTTHVKLTARAEVDLLLMTFRQQGCYFCREMHHACLSAHHRRKEEKRFTIADARQKGYPLEDVKRELAKCMCLCLNCHSKLHELER